MSVDVSGVISWLKGWFYDKDEVNSLITQSGGVIVDSSLDGTSSNPVENQAIVDALSSYVNRSELGTLDLDITSLELVPYSENPNGVICFEDTGVTTGSTITDISKTGTNGLVDTYTITYGDSSTDTFTVTNGADGQNGTNGTNGTNGIGISDISKTNTSGLIDTYTITYSNGDTDTFTVTNGADGQNGTNGTNGTNGLNGATIWTTSTAPTTPNYTFTISNLTAQTGRTPQIGDLIVYSYYRYTIAEVGSTTVKATPRVSIRGAKGDTGATGSDGADGKGISSISKTSTSGLVDTYTITYSDNTTSAFTINNGADGQTGQTGATGNGISQIALQSTSGKVKTYRITYTNGNYFDFQVTDGADGNSASVTIITSSDGWSSTLSDSAVASEKLVKNSLDNKSDTTHGHDSLTGSTSGLELIEDDSSDIAIFGFGRKIIYDYNDTDAIYYDKDSTGIDANNVVATIGDLPSDISDLSDTNSLIPVDVSDLTDNSNTAFTPKAHTHGVTDIANTYAYNNIKSGESTTLTLTSQKLLNDEINTKFGSIETLIGNAITYINQ